MRREEAIAMLSRLSTPGILLQTQTLVCILVFNKSDRLNILHIFRLYAVDLQTETEFAVFARHSIRVRAITARSLAAVDAADPVLLLSATESYNR